MATQSVEMRLQQLSADIAALKVLVEALWAQDLADEQNPRAIVEVIIDDLFQKEETIRASVGNDVILAQVSNAVSDLLSRAAMRASLRKSSKSPPQS
jgi:hypothetical protein